MRTVALVLLGLIAVNAVFVKKVSDPNASVFTEMEEIDNNDMGRKLLDTIALQMKNKAPLADIARMLQNLRENLVLQQQDADVEHAANEADCEAEITGYNRRIDFASNEIQEATTEINQLQSLVNQLTTQIENIASQLQILTEQEEVLRAQRVQEEQDFAVRMQQSREVIEALDVVSSKLSGITPETDAAQVFIELHKMGGTNPIAALVSLASAFSPEKLANVQQKVAELRSSMEQSIVDDRENETQAQLDFQTLLAQFADQRQNLVTARNEAERRLQESQNALGMQRRRHEDAGRELTAATNGKNQKEAECESQRTQYARDTEQRNKEVAIVRQVEQILATKIEGASSYLKERVDRQ